MDKNTTVSELYCFSGAVTYIAPIGLAVSPITASNISLHFEWLKKSERLFSMKSFLIVQHDPQENVKADTND